jgi:hypothetical protein
MTIELNNSEIEIVGGGLKFPSDIVCVYPAPKTKEQLAVEITFQPSMPEIAKEQFGVE